MNERQGLCDITFIESATATDETAQPVFNPRFCCGFSLFFVAQKKFKIPTLQAKRFFGIICTVKPRWSWRIRTNERNDTMKYKIQTARGAAVGTHHFNDAKWSDKIFGYNGLTLDECRNELIDDIKTAADCDDEEFEECYTAAIDDVTNASVAELADDFIVFVDGREKAWRIVED